MHRHTAIDHKEIPLGRSGKKIGKREQVFATGLRHIRKNVPPREHPWSDHFIRGILCEPASEFQGYYRGGRVNRIGCLVWDPGYFPYGMDIPGQIEPEKTGGPEKLRKLKKGITFMYRSPGSLFVSSPS